MKCSYCGEEITGEVVAPGGQGVVEREEEFEVGFEDYWNSLGFCSAICAWRWGQDREKLCAEAGAEFRRFILGEQGLKSLHPKVKKAHE